MSRTMTMTMTRTIARPTPRPTPMKAAARRTGVFIRTVTPTRVPSPDKEMVVEKDSQEGTSDKEGASATAAGHCDSAPPRSPGTAPTPTTANQNHGGATQHQKRSSGPGRVRFPFEPRTAGRDPEDDRGPGSSTITIKREHTAGATGGKRGKAVPGGEDSEVMTDTDECESTTDTEKWDFKAWRSKWLSGWWKLKRDINDRPKNARIVIANLSNELCDIECECSEASDVLFLVGALEDLVAFLGDVVRIKSPLFL